MASPASSTPPKPANDDGPTAAAVPADKPKPKKADAPAENGAETAQPGESVARP